MDGERFDAWTATLARFGSRRTVWRALAGSTFAGVGFLTAVGAPRQTGAEPTCPKARKCGKQGGEVVCCAPGQICVGKGPGGPKPTCCPKSNVCGHRCGCPLNKTCVCIPPPPFGPPPDPADLCRCICQDGFVEAPDGSCVCPSPCGQDCCEDGEICCGERGNRFCILSNRSNCGTCGNVCGRTEICKGRSACCVESGPPGPHNTCCHGFVCKEGECVCTGP